MLAASSSTRATLTAALRGQAPLVASAHLTCRRQSLRTSPPPRIRPSRLYSTAPLLQGSSVRISTVFYALIAIGVGSTAYGLYDFYKSFAIWPPEVRADLRAGVKAKHQGDLDLSERFLQRAYDTALALPLESLSPAPYLKISGIAATLGDVLESNNRPKAAYDVYVAALAHLQAHSAELSGEERLRGVALAHKLGEMAYTYQVGEEEEERWLSWAVEEMVRVTKNLGEAAGAGSVGLDGEEPKVILAELELPRWMSVADVGAPVEALGAFYARMGNIEYAVPLYLQAISLLVPPPNSGKHVSAAEICRGAQLMSNLSELLMRGSPSPQKVHQAELWAKQGLSVIEKTQKNARGSRSESEGLQICEEVLAVTLFNLASIREVSQDLPAARELFQRSLDQSKRIGLREGVSQARLALHRLERTQEHSLVISQSPSPSASDSDKRPK
ncbi:hypothetical protein HETIRDRAFT_325616 [Heterobasidion irregulare TC 32-1]|uniref:Uncharacterized protein n=1 Tax=Heterobasidion irregulare (strain TC 32-1) TaxID=747525 RepID=W4JWX5_HETIT|nr:uncharacterized protein HETIRDRAFT_325616 [Heterobasidion irregulare TC 32-1]ETW78062.1 hypothetical protein HETIRDRAFT_325616 [Heterobasidion irregulare TC 32-1]